jgi:lysozyme family protein
LIALLALAACERKAPAPPETSAVPFQEDRWRAAEIRAAEVPRLDKAVARFRRTENRYREIEHQRPNGVPEEIVFALHGRESAWDFTRHLHEGSPLTQRTRNIPKGRPLVPEPPYTFEQSAEDALYVLKRMDLVNWRSLGDSLQATEAYNGLGYQKYHPDVPSPYLWSGTSLYTRGKYIADGRFSPSAVDKQLGCAAILKRLEWRR